MYITRKIELHISESDPEKRLEQRKYLGMLDAEIYRAANLIVTNQLFNDYYENRVINKDGTLTHIDSRIRSLYRNKEKNAEEINTLKEMKKERWDEAKKFYETSKQNITYQLTSRDFPDIPGSIVTALNASIIKTLKHEWNDVKSGSRSLRTYKKGMPIPFNFNVSKKWFEKVDDDIFMNWYGNIKFRLHFGRDRSNNKTIIERCLSGEYKYSDSSIQIKDSKIFLLLVVDIPINENKFNQNLSVGVDLGLTVPAYCVLSNGFKSITIGSKEDLLRIRLQFQNRKQSLQKRLKLVPGGKGRRKKLCTFDKLADKENRYVTTYNHMISANVIKFAKDHGAGVIKMEMLEGFGDHENHKFVLRNWSYFQLQTMIEYKAKKESIAVVYIDPYHTSQTCAVCGNYQEGQRLKQEEFVCKNEECENFNLIVNADYNAALNIAKSNKIVSSKEDCVYFNKNIK